MVKSETVEPEVTIKPSNKPDMKVKPHCLLNLTSLNVRVGEKVQNQI